MPRTSRHDLPSINAGLNELARIVREMRQGRMNIAGEVTITNGTTTTLIEDQQFGATTVLTLTPRTDPGASWRSWTAARSKGSITVGHPNPGSDLVCDWLAQG